MKTKLTTGYKYSAGIGPNIVPSNQNGPWLVKIKNVSNSMKTKTPTKSKRKAIKRSYKEKQENVGVIHYGPPMVIKNWRKGAPSKLSLKDRILRFFGI
jgi:hypothetical protein